LKKAYGTWAVVTGATDGIGFAMAQQMAQQGMNVVLISRSKEKLEVSAQAILAKCPKVEVRTLDVDYSVFDEAARTRVTEFLRDLEVGVLLNNVGISYPYTRFFYELDDSTVDQLITLNVSSTTWMTRIVLPGMLARKRGAIVNMASAAGVLNSPLLAQYGAAK
jgi:17beta-estradiol 17-dehydrogenase / very-long-chain 3-oxoacyl-CoA reductase